MTRAPFLVAALSMLAALAWAARLATAPAPLAASSALLVAAGILGFGLITTTGLLLSRGRWARNVALALGAFELAMAAVIDLDAITIAATVLSGAALVASGGPWLDGWLRRRPAAGAPGPRPLLVTIGGLVLVPALGLVAPGGVGAAHLVLGAAAVTAAWAYARSHPWGLWGFRVVIPAVGVPAVLASPFPGSLVLAAGVAALTAVAWTREARLAVDPELTTLPGPRPFPRRRDAS
ncbi:MAG: hypothetical protein PVI35_02845 [Acidimicrobiia bacterium]|jgi:hypothetical protein